MLSDLYPTTYWLFPQYPRRLLSTDSCWWLHQISNNSLDFSREFLRSKIQINYLKNQKNKILHNKNYYKYSNYTWYKNLTFDSNYSLVFLFINTQVSLVNSQFPIFSKFLSFSKFSFDKGKLWSLLTNMMRSKRDAIYS